MELIFQRLRWDRYRPEAGKIQLVFLLFLLFAFSPARAGKTTLVLKVKQPLRAEQVKIRLPSVTNAKGERRDLEAVLPLGPENKEAKVEESKVQVEDLSLALHARTLGKNGLVISFTLPNPGFVEIVMLDSYGKNFATVVSNSYPQGRHILPPFTYQGSEQNGVRFLALKVDGKLAKQKMLPQVK